MPGVILLVEDDENDLVLLRRALAVLKLKNPLHVCENGEDAIAFLNSREPDDHQNRPVPILILLDLKLPRRSGAEILGWMESRPWLHSIPVVAITGQTDPRRLGQALHLGVVSVLKKPVSCDSIVESLKATNRFQFEEDDDGVVLKLL